MKDPAKIISGNEWLRVLGLLAGIKLVVIMVFVYSHHYLPRADWKTDIWMTRPTTTLSQNLANFDGAWFVRIAALGYQKLTSGDYDLAAETAKIKVLDRLGYDDGISRNYAYRHWPLFPWLIKAAAPVFGGNFLAAGAALANLFYFLYGVFFYKLARLDFPEQTSFLALTLALVHPGAYSLTAIYNEPVFLCCAAASLYFMRRDKYLGAGLFAGLASMTRIEAVVIYIPLIYQYLRKSAGADAGLLAPLGAKNFGASLARIFREPRSLWLLLAPAGKPARAGLFQKALRQPLHFRAGARGQCLRPFRVPLADALCNLPQRRQHLPQRTPAPRAAFARDNIFVAQG